MSGTELDITERKRTEEALRDAQARLQRWNAELEEAVNVKTAALQESQQRLDLAQRAARIGTFDWNLHTGVNVWTPELEAMYGLKAGEFAGTQRAWEDFVHPDDRENAIAGVNHSLATGEQVEREFRVVWHDGTLRWLLGRWQMLRDHAGQPLRVTGINIDITERKKAEEQLRSTQDRLRALGTELNLAEQRERKRLATELHDHLQQMLVLGKLTIGQGKRFALGIPDYKKMINKLDDLLSDALSYTRTLVAELSPPALREHGLAAGLRWLADSMKKYEMTVSINVPDRRENLPEDQSTLLFLSVRELLINSSKHAHTGEAAVNMTLDGGQLKIIVSDKGRGFDIAAAITAAADTTGGLSSKFGLFSIRERMQALGGSFDIKSSPGEGTVATLILPLIPQNVGTVEHALQKTTDFPLRAVGNDTSDGKIRVLVADDHAVVRQGLRAMLDSYPEIEVVGEASNGNEALVAVKKLRPHVVVMDVNMPDMNGIDATTKIKALDPNIVIVGLSVNAGGENRQAMLSAGASAFLTKEGPIESLHHAIGEAVGLRTRLVLDRERSETAGTPFR